MSHIHEKPISKKAGEDLTGKEGRYVKFGADGKTVVLAGAGDKAIGTLRSGNVEDGQVDIDFFGGGSHALCGAAAITRGDSVKVGALGVAVTGTADTWCPSIAMEDAVAGDLFEVYHAPHYKSV